MRKGETQIGILIIFSITLVIALGVVGIIMYFYNNNKNEERYTSILGNIFSKKTSINAIGLCSGAASAIISYNPTKDEYTLKCDVELGKKINTITQIIKLDGCNSNDTYCFYKIKK